MFIPFKIIYFEWQLKNPLHLQDRVRNIILKIRLIYLKLKRGQFHLELTSLFIQVFCFCEKSLDT